tara:strand:- start:2342 stop:2806 length:465 start_codon:yes stop_codon:yes gene_type:complete
MSKKYFFLFFFGIFFSVSLTANNLYDENVFLNLKEKILQDNSILIKKIKAKISALSNRRNKLKDLNKWSDFNEKNYLLKVHKLKENLKKLGEKPTENLTPDEIIKKLQKQLKFLNNARVNKNAKDTFTEENDSVYKQKAGKLIDSIIKLRMTKN